MISRDVTADLVKQQCYSAGVDYVRNNPHGSGCPVDALVCREGWNSARSNCFAFNMLAANFRIRESELLAYVLMLESELAQARLSASWEGID